MGLKDEIQFLKYCFGKRKDARFRRNVTGISDNYSLVNLSEMGGSEEMGSFYYIDMEPSYSGFFADHNRLLSLLYFADYYGLKPVVKYSDEYTYREEHPVNGTSNPFEYYFEQPAGVSPEDLKQYSGVLCCRKENAALAGLLNKNVKGGYGMSEEYMAELGRISQKYIRLNDTVAPVIEHAIEEMTRQKRTLGVHVRGTDFKRNYNGHPVCVTVEEYLEEAKRLYKEKGYERVFLATDDQKTIQIFQEVFGENLSFYDDVIRSDGDETVMKSTVSRENHHYLLGLEVLRDMMTLAACDGLVAGLSQVSYSARIKKKGSGKEYEDLSILFKGINKNRTNCKI